MTLDQIANQVSSAFGFDPFAIHGASRHEPLAGARLAYYFLARKRGHPSGKIAAYIGRTRAAAIRGSRTASNRIDTEPQYRATFALAEKGMA